SAPSGSVAPPPSREKVALWTAIDDLRRTIVMLDAMIAVQPKRRPFSWVVRQKRRHERRLVTITNTLGHGDPPVLWQAEQFVAPRDRAEGCAAAKRQELRNAAIYETALGEVKSPRARAHLRRMLQKTRYRHLVVFEVCIAAA
ncbi:MAG TPA: hypothetical protein VFG69_14515, partial [Nannocystaceae bacterium]|nr:hypothetical protein [Nannocystaceae bacterium]